MKAGRLGERATNREPRAAPPKGERIVPPLAHLLGGLEHGDAAGLDLVVVVLGEAYLEHFAVRHRDGAVGELPNAKLGPLEVAQNLHLDALGCRRGADEGVHALKVSAAAVGAVEAEDVDPRVDHLRDHLVRPRGRSHGRHDLDTQRGRKDTTQAS